MVSRQVVVRCLFEVYLIYIKKNPSFMSEKIVLPFVTLKTWMLGIGNSRTVF
jgi:hypothetical protein